jgi:hypothetical protein
MSITVGISAAVLVGLVGPLWGGLVVVLATPVVFLTVSRALFHAETAPEWDLLLVSGGLAWIAFLPFAPVVYGDRVLGTDEWLWLLGLGAAPLVAGLIIAYRRRRPGLSSRVIARH